MSEIVIREADLDDPAHQHAVVDLINAYSRDPMGSGADLPEAVRGDLVAGLRAHPTTRIFVAFNRDAPIGIAVCFQGFSTFYARPLINIHDLAVLAGYRGQGVGRRLLDAVEAAARASNCCKVTLEVRDDNDRARRLYAAHGFIGGGDAASDERLWFMQKRL
jgi:ribosomal protein S18 acetylase RimI-like enzyme